MARWGTRHGRGTPTGWTASVLAVAATGLAAGAACGGDGGVADSSTHSTPPGALDGGATAGVDSAAGRRAASPTTDECRTSDECPDGAKCDAGQCRWMDSYGTRPDACDRPAACDAPGTTCVSGATTSGQASVGAAGSAGSGSAGSGSAGGLCLLPCSEVACPRGYVCTEAFDPVPVCRPAGPGACWCSIVGLRDPKLAP